MATPSLPKTTAAVPISEDEFQRLQTAYFGIDSLFFILRQASWGPGSIADSMENVLEPFTDTISLLVQDLEHRFKEAAQEAAKGGAA